MLYFKIKDLNKKFTMKENGSNKAFKKNLGDSKGIWLLCKNNSNDEKTKMQKKQ